MFHFHRRSTKCSALFLGFICLCLKFYQIRGGYAPVYVHSSDGNPHNEGPKIFKALNMDLIYPRNFNSTENNMFLTTKTPTTALGTTTEPTLKDTKQSQQPEEEEEQQQQQHQHYMKHHKFSSTAQRIQPAMPAAEQSIIYVTPPPPHVETDITPPRTTLTTNNYDESNAEAILLQSTTRTTANTNINPKALTLNNNQKQQQQLASAERDSDNEAPADTLAAQQPTVYSAGATSTGRAATATEYNYRPAYNFNKLITPSITKSRPLLVGGAASSLLTPSSSSTSLRAAHTRPRVVAVTTGAVGRPLSHIGHVIYPQAHSRRRPTANRAEINKLNGKALFSDRFTPAEAVASGTFVRQRNQHKQQQGNTKLATAASQIVQQTYKPTSDSEVYAFPPNHTPYTSPYQDPKASLPSNSVNSYAAPPSGPIVPTVDGGNSNLNYPLVTAANSDDSGYKYPGPINPDVGDGGDDAKQQMSMQGGDEQNNAMDIDGGGTTGAGGDNGEDADLDSDSDDTIGVLPASAMGDADGKDAGMAGSMNGGGGGVADDVGDMTDVHDHDHPPPIDDTEYPTPPPGWVEQHPETVHDPPSHHYPPSLHHSSHPYSSFSSPHVDHHHYANLHDHYPAYIHPYPQIIWDSSPKHPPPLPPPPMATEAPMPPPPHDRPAEARVKKYSYFYIGRKLWYIPLYFTVWFSFYVLWLILKSIARHKVNLPNHYTGTVSDQYVNKRSLPDFVPTNETHANEYINKLTVSVLEKIENFQRKYGT